MKFDKYVAIDWSGAKNPRSNKHIQVAEYDPENRNVSLVHPLSTGKFWTRKGVFEYVRRMVAEQVVLIGFDFAFAYPYCDKGEYFPGEPSSPPDVQRLWEKVEEVCGSADNFYGGPFYRDSGSPFKDFHHYPGCKGVRYEQRYRVTDKKAKKQKLRPSSVFKCIGPGQVGPGSVAGMRLLLSVRQETTASIWPFDAIGAPTRSTVVEIYPRLFLELSRE